MQQLAVDPRRHQLQAAVDARRRGRSAPARPIGTSPAGIAAPVRSRRVVTIVASVGP